MRPNTPRHRDFFVGWVQPINNPASKRINMMGSASSIHPTRLEI